MKNNKSGFKGVFFNTQKHKWRAKITIDKKVIVLGDFKNIENAIRAREEAEKSSGYELKQKPTCYNKHGQFIDGKLVGRGFILQLKQKEEREKEFTQERLKEILSYDSNTGIFYWIKPFSDKYKIGDIAGRIDTKGYGELKLYNKSYRLHRLAWLYIYGKFPELDLDHINGIKTDNRIENLREVTDQENAQNRTKAQVNNKLGVL